MPLVRRFQGYTDSCGRSCKVSRKKLHRDRRIQTSAFCIYARRRVNLNDCSEAESINICIYHEIEYLRNKHVRIVIGMSVSKFGRCVKSSSIFLRRVLYGEIKNRCKLTHIFLMCFVEKSNKIIWRITSWERKKIFHCRIRYLSNNQIFKKMLHFYSIN